MADIDTARLVVSLEAKIDQFEKKLDRANGVANTRTRQIEKRFRAANDSIVRGMSSVGTSTLAASVASERLVKGMSKSAEVTKEVGHAAGLASGQSQALFHSMRSGAESIALGVPVTTALTQQLNHLTYAASGPGGLSGAFKQVARFIGGILTPVRLAIGGVVGLAGAALYAATSFASAQEKIDLALSGIGRASGVTVDSINRIADTVSSAGEVSAKEARQIATAIAATGKASEEATGKATMLAHAFSLVTGGDLKETAQELAGIFADPAKGVDTLNAKLGAFNDAETQSIKLMAAANDRMGAQRALADGLQRALVGVTEKTSSWSRAWDAVANGASNAFDAVGRAIDRAAGLRTPQEAFDEAKAFLDRASTPGRFGINTSELARAQAEFSRAKKALDEFNAAAARTGANVASVDFGNFVRGLDPAVAQIGELEAKLSHLKEALADPNIWVGADVRESAERLASATQAQIDLTKQYIALAKERYGIASQALGQEIAAADLERKALAARLPEEKAYIAGLQAEMAARQQGASVAEAAARGDLARNAALSQSYKDLSDQALDASKTFANDIASGLYQGTSAAESLGNALDNLAKKLLEMGTNRLVEAALGPLFDGLFGVGSSGGGGSGGGIGAILAGVLHDGGVAGRDGYGKGRMVAPSTFRGARRYHSGGIAGLKPDEVPAILQKGEMVIPKIGSVKSASGGGADAPPVIVNATFNVENGTAEGVAKLKQDIVPLMKQIAQTEIVRTFERRGRFARSGI